MPLFGALLSLPVPEDRYPTLNLTPQRQRQKTLEAILAIILEWAARQPVLFILEDLHWTDPTTLEFIELLIEQAPTASVYILLTCRPEFQPWWSHRSYLTEMTVHRLSQPQIERMAQQVAGGKGLPDEIIHQLVDKTDGVPLYVEEMTKTVLESGILKETNGHYELAGSISTLSIPATLQDSLMARLDRLVTAKAVAQYASVIGRQFSYELLQAVSQLNETMLQHELGRLVEAELVYQRGLPPQVTYIFKHALIQDAAYQSLLRSTRQQYHQRIAQVLEKRFPETAEWQPELLAHHYTEAGLSEQAVGYWQRAGEQTIQRSAYIEAIAHLSNGLAVLNRLPETSERAQQKLALYVMLGTPLIATKGWTASEVEHTYLQAHTLCQGIGETSDLFMVLWGLWTCKQVQGHMRTAREFAEQCFNLLQCPDDPVRHVGAHFALGQVLFCSGEFSASRTHIEQAIGFYDIQQHDAYTLRYGSDLGVFCLVWMSHVLWHLGYLNQALAKSDEALSLAQELSHPFSLALALDYRAMLHQFRREPQTAQTQAESAITLCTEQGFAYYLAWGIIIQNWALTELGQAEGIAQMRQGLDALRTTGGGLRLPYYLALLAEACGKVNQAEEGLPLVLEALTLVDKNDERWYKAEIHRLKGQLLLQQSSDNATEAESCFQQAISIAQHQSAKSWELRAATSLARLWQIQGKRDQARELLGDVYGWFTEGFDTADLIDAKTLLDELEVSRS